jgi:hypothetical protein
MGISPAGGTEGQAACHGRVPRKGLGKASALSAPGIAVPGSGQDGRIGGAVALPSRIELTKLIRFA